jgi:hypothetical protein
MVGRPILIKTDQRIEEAVEGLTSPESRMGVYRFVNFREAVKETPGIARRKLRMDWLAPLVEDLRNLNRGDRSAINCTDSQIVSTPICDWLRFVSGDPLIESAESITELTHGSSREMTEIA